MPFHLIRKNTDGENQEFEKSISTAGKSEGSKEKWRLDTGHGEDRQRIMCFGPMQTEPFFPL